MKKSRFPALIFLYILFVGLFAACNPVNKITFADHQAFDEQVVSRDLCIAFNGVANFYLRYNGKAVMTDPFMSNPGLWKLAFGTIEPDIALIDRLQPKVKDIRMITIGHAHYDHILDLPYFADKVDAETKIIGSDNAIKIANAIGADWETVSVSGMLADAGSEGQWVYAADSSVRILPIRSAHLPHIFGMHLFEGEIQQDKLEAFPNKNKQFTQDQTLAYLIDFLGKNLQPEKRIYFSSSATAPLNGFFPASILEEKSVDVAILSVALAQKAEGYPKDLMDILQPSVIIACHWENFFRTAEQTHKFVSMTKFKKVMKALEESKGKADVIFLKPGSSIIL
jgi:L-ascorbate metabolism protein UlaG (beta-lactamase superfamily)